MPMLRKNPEIIGTTVTETVLQQIQHADNESARKGSRGRPVMVSLAGPGPPPAEMQASAARSAAVPLGAENFMRALAGGLSAPEFRGRVSRLRASPIERNSTPESAPNGAKTDR